MLPVVRRVSSSSQRMDRGSLSGSVAVRVKGAEVAVSTCKKRSAGVAVVINGRWLPLLTSI